MTHPRKTVHYEATWNQLLWEEKSLTELHQSRFIYSADWCVWMAVAVHSAYVRLKWHSQLHRHPAVATEMSSGVNGNLVYLSHRHFVAFFVTAFHKQLVHLMPFPDTSFCSGQFIFQPPLPVPFPLLMLDTTFFISVCVLNMICS
jgi:hypothetical protein